MKPTPHVVDLIRGVLARAARLYPVEIHAFCFLSNHFHLLLSVSGADRLARFMNHLNSNLAREVGRHVQWRERFWGRRYQAILVSHEEAAQTERLLYILRHGCKENLVRRPGDWPGATSTAALLSGERIRGTWYDRTREYQQARTRRLASREQVAEIESLVLSPLPCWRELSPEAHRQRCIELVTLVEAEAERRIRESGREPLGRERILLADPYERLSRTKRGPAPFVHAATRDVREVLRERYRRFLEAFRRAAERLRIGVSSASEALLQFPPGCFPPPLRYLPNDSGFA